MKLAIKDLTKSYTGRNETIEALSPISFTIEEGEFVSLLGPSGCGKSTALALIAGLEDATAGEVLIDGARVTGPGKDRGMVFQSSALFPWLTVAENARFGSGLACNVPRRQSRAQREDQRGADLGRTRHLLDVMGLADFYDAYPRELSGGMKQRVAIARALANRPKVLLMDEPFGALDAQTREEMQELMLLLCAHERTTVLFVTHDVEEAIYLSTRVVVFSPRPGRVIADRPVPFGAGGERNLDLKLTPEFLQQKRELIRLLHADLQPGSHRGALLEKLVQHPN